MLCAAVTSARATAASEAEAAYQAAAAAEKANPTKANAEATDAALAALLALQGGPTGAPESPLTPPTPVAEVEPNGTSATATPVPETAGYARVEGATINPGGDVDFFTITGCRRGRGSGSKPTPAGRRAAARPAGTR